jgi:hypothetical protein
MTRYAVAILLALTMPASAADIVSANHFLPGCKSALSDNKVLIPADALLQGRCTGFVQAFLAASPALDFCQPKGATISQSVALVVKYIEARPERMHEPFGVLALEALKAAWPCKR